MSSADHNNADAATLRRKELARFLRTRREAISPELAGLPRLRRRRTPGLRREEVALLAGIGAAWYGRLEMAHDIAPSTETLLAIARSLKLSVVETEYVFELAGLAAPKLHDAFVAPIPEAIEQLIPSIQGVGAILFDRYLTIVRWNAIGDALFGFSAHPDPIDRNAIRRLINNPVLTAFFGEDFERYASGVVGMFRRAYVGAEPTPFAHKLYEDIQAHPILARFWKNQVVEEDIFEGGPGPFERHHPDAGTLLVVSASVQILRQEGMILRVVAPADEKTRAHFERLAAAGSPSTRQTLLP